MFDMHGNAGEWIQENTVVGPLSPVSNNLPRGLRGGSYFNPGSEYIRAPFKGQYPPRINNVNLGFRLEVR